MVNFFSLKNTEKKLSTLSLLWMVTWRSCDKVQPFTNGCASLWRVLPAALVGKGEPSPEARLDLGLDNVPLPSPSPPRRGGARGGASKAQP